MSTIQIGFTAAEVAALVVELAGGPGNSQTDIETPEHVALVIRATRRLAFALEVAASAPPPLPPAPAKPKRGRPAGRKSTPKQEALPATAPAGESGGAS
ncbi:MAG TPA: hypothetical protein VII08_10540 [Myxococcales bacterium]